MVLVLVALGSFMLGLLCMSLLASASIGDLQLEAAERRLRERRNAMRTGQQAEQELLGKAS